MTREPRDAPQFYLTSPSPAPICPTGRSERSSPIWSASRRGVNDKLTLSGFRRSQTIAYRPACEHCRACVSVRVKVAEFHPSRNFRRVLEHNADFLGVVGRTEPTGEQYSLFRHYLDARHGEGGMADMTILDYSMMVEDSHVESRLVEYRAPDPNARRERPAARRLPHRFSGRRPVDGLFLLRAGGAAPFARHLHDPRPYRTRARGSACHMSISAIGSRAPRRWPTRRASCRRSGSA